MTHSLVRFVRTVVVSKPCLTFAALLLGVLAPRAASAVVQGAELYRTQAYFYGRFEARVRFAPGEGVVSSFFLWKDGSSSTTTWNELDFEKINSDCRLQTNIWTAQGTQSAMINTPSFNICNDYHTYAFEWTPDYIAWFIDGSQIRKVTGASVTEYTKNASAGMAMHFNIWQGDSSFGGNLSTSTLPVYEYISWAQYSSYANNAFTLQWREEFTGSTTPANWALGNWLAPLNHSMHNPANAKFVNGIAVLALTNDNATGYSGTPPADPASGGTTGTGGAGGTTGSAGTSGTAGTGGGGAGAGGGAGRGGAGASGSPGSGGTTSTGAAGNGAAGTTGRGGRSTGTAGTTGAAGTTGTAGTTGAAGTTGTAGTTGEAGTSGSGGTVGTGGTSDTGAAGTTGTGGTSSGGAGSTGSGEGCGCRAAGDGLTGSGVLITVLLIAGLALRRRPRRAQSL